MAELWTNYIWPLIVIVAQSVLLLVILLIITAYVLYANRKIWAAVQIRRGPMWSDPEACCNPSRRDVGRWTDSFRLDVCCLYDRPPCA
jgi:NADH dehydrogenase